MTMPLKLPVQTIPAQLWHYTTLAGMEEIARTQCLLATPFYFLHELLIEELFATADRAWWMGAAEEILPAFRGSFVRVENDAFVVSFFGEQDLRRQWLRFVEPKQRGVAVKFEPRSLIDVAKLSGFEFVKCFYEQDEEPRAMLFDGPREHVAKFKDLPSDPDRRNAEREKIARELALALRNMAP
jgi:hypothetical protein